MDIDQLFVDAHLLGSGPTIVLVHGAADRASTFDRLLPYLPDYSVVTYDRRGYAQSVQAGPPQGMADHAIDLLAILEDLPRPHVVVGHSFGSNPTMLAVSLRPDAFDAIGLWEPPLPWVDWWPQDTKRINHQIVNDPDPEAAAEGLYRRLLGDARWERLPRTVQAERRAEGLTVQRDMASELVKPFEFADVKVPALVGHGTATSDYHAHGSAWLAEQLPDGRHVIIEGAGHFAHRTHPEQFAAFVQETVALSGA